MEKKGFLERLQNGENIVIAEGYMFELERRGYLSFGAMVPEVVLEHPEKVKEVHEDFIHAGTDVVEAFTYYANREKLRLIGRDGDMKPMNIKALQIARGMADKHGKIMSAGLCNSTIFDPDNKETVAEVVAMFKEQVEWFVEGGCDYIIAETFEALEEAMLALDAIKKYGNGVPAVITLAPYAFDLTVDEVPIPEACRQLEDAGAAVVGLNCARGPKTMLPLMRKVRQACKGPIACVPVPFRTDAEHVTMQTFVHPETGKSAYMEELSMFMCPRSEITDFAKQAKEIGIEYVGLCCGNCPHYFRILAETYGRTPPASKYAPDLAKHFTFGEASELYGRSTKIKKWMTGKD